MSRRLPSLNALRAFEAAARLGGVTRAADELHVTQSAVSRQIRALEEEVGVTLFQRVHRGVVLSPEGRALAATLSDAFGRMAEGLDRLRQEPEVVRVRVPPTFGVRWLWPRLRGFESLHPDVRLQISILWREIGPTDLDYDIGVRLMRKEEVGSAPVLFGERMVPVCAPDYLARHSRPVTAGDFEHAPLLHCTTVGKDWSTAAGTDWGHWALHWSGGAFTVDRGERFDTLDLALRAAEAGRGIAVTDLAMVEDDLSLGRLVKAADEVIENGQAYVLVERASPASAPKAQAAALFRAWLLEEASRTREKLA